MPLSDTPVPSFRMISRNTFEGVLLPIRDDYRMQ